MIQKSMPNAVHVYDLNTRQDRVVNDPQSDLQSRCMAFDVELAGDLASWGCTGHLYVYDLARDGQRRTAPLSAQRGHYSRLRVVFGQVDRLVRPAGQVSKSRFTCSPCLSCGASDVSTGQPTCHCLPKKRGKANKIGRYDT